MNVWWHHVKSVEGSQGEEDEALNKRIQNELLPYPSDDQFISWDIYKSILDKCGVSECLTPLFNLWDKLGSGALDEIRLASQAIWDIDDVKWNFFEGYKNNDGKETYPSQMASYDLLKYFQIGEYKHEHFGEWMRVVWNIVENANIDSLDSYQSALNLINEITKGKDAINEWVADANTEIKSGFACEQVEEERAKVRQMVADRNTWEKAIIEAEQFAFFKGAIRFLFRNEKGEICWDDFPAKWNNAQMLFNEDGVKKEWVVQLVRLFVLNCNNWWRQLYNQQIFTPDATTWRLMLLGKNNARAIHYCLMLQSAHEKFANQPAEEHARELLCDKGLLTLLISRKNFRLH